MKLYKLLGIAILSLLSITLQARELPGHVPSGLARLKSMHRAEPTNQMHLCIGLPSRNPQELDALIADIYNPNSPKYHQFVTQSEFINKFGPTAESYNAVRQFALANGLQIRHEHNNRLVIDVVGSVSNVERALNVQIQVFQHPTEKRTFFAPTTEPTIDPQLPIQNIQGLSDYARPKPAQLTPQVGTGANGSYKGYDFRKAYAPNVTLTGTGQQVGLVEFDGYYAADIKTYETQSGLPAVPLSNVLLDGLNGAAGANNSEVALDIEMAIAMAPGLSQVVVYEGNYPNSIISSMTANTAVKQFSCSWTWGTVTDPTTDTLFKQLAAQGQSFFQASGDSDAYTGAVDFPSDSPYVTSVGGTTLTTTAAQVWSSEKTWNWGSGVGTGGGICTNYALPTWQQGIATTGNRASTVKRNIPDVAMAADAIYVVYNNGTAGVFGGTSCSTPLWAAFTALANQQAVASGKSTVGFLNPNLYSLGKSPSYATLFHDINTGNNSGFVATNGFDLCTGWGTPTGQPLLNALSGSTIVTTTTGAIQVTLNPNTIGGMWKLDNGTNQVSGAIASQVTPGSHTISFTAVTSWITPASQTVTVSAGNTVQAVGTYTSAQHGSIQITVAPAGVVSAGGTWQLDGVNKLSGVMVTNITLGTHTVSFTTVSGWVTPASFNVNVTANLFYITSVTYAKVPTGNVVVNISPSAAGAAGARWFIDGGSLHTSGSVVTNLSTGFHTLQYTTIPGYTSPPISVVNIVSNMTSTINVTYIAAAVKPKVIAKDAAPIKVYKGIFYNTNQLSLTTCGSLIVTNQGLEYTAIVQIGNNNYKLSGTTDSGVIINRQSKVAVALQLNAQGDTYTGWVTTRDGYSSAYAYTALSNAPSGEFAVLFTDKNEVDTGAGLAKITNGSIEFTAILADGTPLRQSTFINNQRQWPFFATTPSGGIIGWVNYTTNGLTGWASWLNSTNESQALKVFGTNSW